MHLLEDGHFEPATYSPKPTLAMDMAQQPFTDSFPSLPGGYLPFLPSYKHTSTHAGSVPRFSLDLVGSIKHFKDTEIISPIEGC
ncbi:hypothetical protein NPIL_408021 [Nephila pilipes]|uniref:Uncharacterized protein n=1 Tax=Nephila pilipes TaxID=299642 RepID=A0A8X6PFP4_NEPPI|nr:hypothetical protein NPIL_408021 [Nephila pilipes]